MQRENASAKNTSRKKLVLLLKAIEYRGCEIEQLQDGRKIVISKPGGKSVYDKPKKDDFLVFVYTSKDNGLWQITHKQIFQDIELKLSESEIKTKELVNLLERIYNGKKRDMSWKYIKTLRDTIDA